MELMYQLEDPVVETVKPNQMEVQPLELEKETDKAKPKMEMDQQLLVQVLALDNHRLKEMALQPVLDRAKEVDKYHQLEQLLVVQVAVMPKLIQETADQVLLLDKEKAQDKLLMVPMEVQLLLVETVAVLPRLQEKDHKQVEPDKDKDQQQQTVDQSQLVAAVEDPLVSQVLALLVAKDLAQAQQQLEEHQDQVDQLQVHHHLFHPHLQVQWTSLLVARLVARERLPTVFVTKSQQ